GTDAILAQADTLARTGSFSDAGDDAWTATVDYGDGTGGALALNDDKSFRLDHEYANEGTFTVTVHVTDADGAEGTGSFLVQVLPEAPGAATEGSAPPGGTTTVSVPGITATLFKSAGSVGTGYILVAAYGTILPPEVAAAIGPVSSLSRTVSYDVRGFDLEPGDRAIVT